MPNLITNKGAALLWRPFQGTAFPTNFYIALITNAVTPTVDTNTLGELTEIAAGNGYTAGGYQLGLNSTDFPYLVEDDTNDIATLQIKDVVWTASGGPIPASGSNPTFAVFTDDNATLANREVYFVWDAVAAAVTAGNTLTLANMIIRGQQP